MIEEDNLESRADNIDVLKAICAFLIVCIHVPFPGVAGEYFTALTRIAVPIFFMITGYFYSDVIDRHREVIQIKKIFRLLIEANLLYLLWDTFYAVLRHNSDFFSTTFTIKNFLKFIVLNESPFKGHLWYLGAILYALLVVYVFDIIRIGKILYLLTPLLLWGDLAFGKYSILIFGREFPYILVRNFLFVGIPYFCLGRLIKSGIGQRIQKNVLAVLMVVFSATSLLERFVLVSFNANATRDHYISTTLLAITVFLFALKCQGDNKTLVLVGRKYSTWLYILHPIFITCIGVVAHKVNVYGIYKFIAPIVVYITTLIFLVIVDKIKIAAVIDC